MAALGEKFATPHCKASTALTQMKVQLLFFAKQIGWMQKMKN